MTYILPDSDYRMFYELKINLRQARSIAKSWELRFPDRPTSKIAMKTLELITLDRINDDRE